MNYSHVFDIALKDMKEAFSSIAIYGPMIGIPLFFAFTLPAFTVYISKFAGEQLLVRILGTAASAAGISSYQTAKFAFVKYFALDILGPIFLTMPIITATVIAADSFAGEKERRTAESLLSTPATNSELLAGKTLASLIPSVLLTAMIYVIYALVTNYLSMLYYGAVIFPNIVWYMMLANAPFLALTTIGLIVLVSSRVKDIKEAQQISSLLVLPILVIPFISVFNAANIDFWFLFEMMLALVASSAFVLYISVRFFDRERFIVA
ncbi:MAG: ABC transporter permease subunit [Candidatus Micrarchaeaceae archaeon]